MDHFCRVTGMPAPAGGQDSSANLERLSVPKASDVLAGELRRQIFNGELAEGSMLPVERLLSATTGLSRGSVRDALRVLEIEGLIATRPGRAGGSFVRRPDATTFERSLNVLVGGQGIRFHALVEAWDALEPAAAALAASHRNDDDILRLEDATRRMDAAVKQLSLFQELNVGWHLAVVEATHNEIMQAYVGSLWRTMARATDVADFHSARTLRDTMAAHRRILDAIRDGDSDRAAAAMKKHTHAYKEEVYRLNLSDQFRI
jgi:GntR family transcriptional repressor for pyruvate dehydrogenase complex